MGMNFIKMACAAIKSEEESAVVLDQYQENQDPWGGQFLWPTGILSFGQTFTSGKTGKLYSIKLKGQAFRDPEPPFLPPSGIFSISIEGTTENGLPNNVIFESQVVNIETTFPTEEYEFESGEYEFEVLFDNVSLIKNKKYAIVLTPTEIEQETAVFIKGITTNEYVGGEHVTQDVHTYEWRAQENGNWDLYFKTYMLV